MPNLGGVRSGFRRELIEVTGGVRAGAHAHHVFPVKFQKQFARAGIDIADPRYGAWWEATDHLSNARAYNRAWEEFFQSSPGADEVLEFGKRIAADYGLDSHF